MKFPLGLKSGEVSPAARPGAGAEAHADPARTDAARGADRGLRRSRHSVPRHGHRHRHRRSRRSRARRPDYRDARQPVGARRVLARGAEGRMLVDGGLSSNLPVDVAREMGVDILIVVDCGFPLLERGKLNSVATVSNQMLAILIRHNTAEQRKTLKDSDVLIDPALGDFSSLDFSQHAKAMRLGEEAARGQTQRLSALSVPTEEFQRIVDCARRQAQRPAAGRIPARRAGLRTLRQRHRGAVQRSDRQARQRDQARAPRRRAVRPGQPRDPRLSTGSAPAAGRRRRSPSPATAWR